MALTIALSVTATLAAAQSWPVKPVRVLIPAGPGGPIDSVLRPVAQALGDALGQPFVVENRGGGEGVIAAEACATAPPDGYLLCGMTKAVGIFGPVLRKNLPYDIRRDFAPVAHLGILDAAIVTHPSVQADSVAQLVALAKAQPDKITWAHFGQNTPSYLYMEWLRMKRGAPFLGVPYKTAVQSQTATLAGEVLVNYYGAGQAAAMVRNGRLKALAVSSDKPLPYLPGVPTFKEAGIDVQVQLWNVLLAPAGTPRAVVDRINAEVERAMADPRFVERYLNPIGITPVKATPDDVADLVKSDLATFGDLARDLNLKVE